MSGLCLCISIQRLYYFIMVYLILYFTNGMIHKTNWQDFNSARAIVTFCQKRNLINSYHITNCKQCLKNLPYSNKTMQD